MAPSRVTTKASPTRRRSPRFCLAWPRWAIGARSLALSMKVAKFVMSNASPDRSRPNSVTIAVLIARSAAASLSVSRASIASQLLLIDDAWLAVHPGGLHQVVVGLVPALLPNNRWHMWVIHLSVHHVHHRHAYLRRSIPVFGPFEGQSDSLTIQLARKLPLGPQRDRHVLRWTHGGFGSLAKVFGADPERHADQILGQRLEGDPPRGRRCRNHRASTVERGPRADDLAVRPLGCRRDSSRQVNGLDLSGAGHLKLGRLIGGILARALATADGRSQQQAPRGRLRRLGPSDADPGPTPSLGAPSTQRGG